MQFVILYIGILVFVFYQFNQAPVLHNPALRDQAMQKAPVEIGQLQADYDQLFAEKKAVAMSFSDAIVKNDEALVDRHAAVLNDLLRKEGEIRKEVNTEIQKAIPGANVLDKDYVFINFVMTYLPHGLIGLLLAVVFSAAMSSTASELTSLASTTTIDIYKRSINPQGDDGHYVKSSRLFTVMWAGFAMVFASIANQAENLIQFVNIIGSLFYGTILGIFLTAFYIKYVKSTAIFWAGILGELIILYCYFFTDIAFLMYNIIGCVAVIVIGLVLQPILGRKE
jgi:Na+(H+)/acetate symporter ActP